MTREEADKEATKINEESKKIFCPFLGSYCRSSCMAYVPAQIKAINLGYSVWSVTQLRCKRLEP